MTKILNVTIDYTKSAGGAALAVMQFSRALEAQTVSFTRLSRLRASASYSDDCIHLPTTGNAFGEAYNYISNKHAQQFRKLVKGSSLVICHLLFRHHNQLVMEECQRNEIPYMVVPHGGLDPYVFTYNSVVKRTWLALLGKRFFRKSSAMICASAREMEKAADKISLKNSTVINWYVPEPRSLDRDICQELVRRRYGLQGQRRLYLMLGRLHSMKRVLETILAFKRADLPNASLLIAGPEEEYTVEQASSYAQNVGAANVLVVGPVYGSDKEELQAASDFSVNFSFRENYCYSIVEGLSYGAPALLTPGNDLASILAEQGCAACCVDEKEASMVEVLRKSAKMDAVDVSNMRNAARIWVKKNASCGAFGQNIAELATRVMAQPEG